MGFCFPNLVPFYLISSEESTQDGDKIVNPDDTSADDDSGKEAKICIIRTTGFLRLSFPFGSHNFYWNKFSILQYQLFQYSPLSVFIADSLRGGPERQEVDRKIIFIFCFSSSNSLPFNVERKKMIFHWFRILFQPT